MMIDVRSLRCPDTDDASTVYAVGDVHGRLDLLIQMEAIIAADIASQRPARPLICYLGDYIDRGPDSALVIDRLCGPVANNVPRIFLKGNHEDRMIAFLQEPIPNGPSWMKFGGREALTSYGIAMEGDAASIDWLHVRDELSRALPETHRCFLIRLRFGLMWHGYLLVHAGLDPDRAVEDQRQHDLMWIREPFLTSSRDWGFRVVHGHVISAEPVFRANRIGIDTGAYQSGRLTCLVLSAHGIRVMQTEASVTDLG